MASKIIRVSGICATTCRCTCHRQHILRTPRVLQQITGRLFVDYSGWPAFRQARNDSCEQRHSRSIKATYFFPKWFVSQAISIAFKSTALGTPNLSIKIRRVVSEVSQLFSSSRHGDAESIRALFSQGLASPDDVHIAGGWGPLHVSSLKARMIAAHQLL